MTGSGSTPSTAGSWACAGGRSPWLTWRRTWRCRLAWSGSSSPTSSSKAALPWCRDESPVNNPAPTCLRRYCMDSGPSDGTTDRSLAAFKILVAGGFGAGKTTFVGAISEVRPLCTEEALTSASASLDDLSGVDNKTTTTVAMDFGRITMGSRLVLYLFGTPGQERFWFMWDELCYGALGAVILADTRRLDDCFPAVDYFEKRQVPFLVAINCFDDAPHYDPEDVRVALDLDPRVPAVLFDARELNSVKQVLITLVEYVLASRSAPRRAAVTQG